MVIKEWIGGRVPHYVVYPIHNPLELWKCLNCGVQAFSSLECQVKIFKNSDLKINKKAPEHHYGDVGPTCDDTKKIIM